MDNVNGTMTTGCASSGAGACKTIQQAVTVADGLSNTNVTLNVAGSSTNYTETGLTINLPSTDTLDIEGTGATQPTLNDGGAGSNITIQRTNAGAVTIDHMTISHGSAESGGAVNDLSTATLIGRDRHLLQQHRDRRRRSGCGERRARST